MTIVDVQSEALRIAAQRLRTGGRSRFYDDPAGFVQHAFDHRRNQRPHPYQLEVLTSLATRRRAAVRGPHGLGKTTINAWATLWFAVTRDMAGVDWKIATTAGAWRQLERFLWPEVHKWAPRLNPQVTGRPNMNNRELLSINLKLDYGQAFAVASDDPQLIEGVHADEVLYIFDESKAIAAGVFDAAEGAFSGTGGAYALATSTPGAPNGRFYDIHARKPGFEDWWTRHVTLDEVLAAGQVDKAWVEQRKLQWGEDSGVYANRVLGEFHSDDESGVVPLSWVEAANRRWQEWDDAGRLDLPGPHTVGVDVARSGEDKTVMALRDGPVCTEIRKFAKQDTMQTTGIVKGILDADLTREAIVDVIGVGGGVVDRLREQGAKVIPFNASESSTKTDRSGELGFINSRSAAWWNIRDLLDPSFGAEIMLPPDEMLTGDLTAPKWQVNSSGKIQVESKDSIKKRLGRSTDDGDAVVQAFWDGVDRTAEQWAEYMRRRSAPKVAEEATVDTNDREALRQASFRAANRQGW